MNINEEHNMDTNADLLLSPLGITLSSQNAVMLTAQRPAQRCPLSGGLEQGAVEMPVYTCDDNCLAVDEASSTSISGACEPLLAQ